MAVNVPVPNPPTSQEPNAASLIIPKIEDGLALTSLQPTTTPTSIAATEVVDLTESPIKSTPPLIHDPPSADTPPAKRIRTEEAPSDSLAGAQTEEDPMLWLPEVRKVFPGRDVLVDDSSSDMDAMLALDPTLLLPIDTVYNRGETFIALAHNTIMDSIKVVKLDFPPALCLFSFLIFDSFSAECPACVWYVGEV